MRPARTRRGESGAAAVEFALVAPLLILLLVGVVELGRVFHAQVTVTAAAREGAREMAIRNDPALALDRVLAATPSLNPALSVGQVSITPATCASGTDVTVEIVYPVPLVTGSLLTEMTVTGRGVMRCGG